jgi:uncharacterized protein YfeS
MQQYKWLSDVDYPDFKKWLQDRVYYICKGDMFPVGLNEFQLKFEYDKFKKKKAINETFETVLYSRQETRKSKTVKKTGNKISKEI